MATLDEVARIALALPEVTEGESRGARTWSVGGKTFAWERPYSKADLKRFDDEKPPNEPIVAVRVDDLIEKEAVLAAGTKGVFTIPHFDGYAAVLIELRTVTKGCAGRRLARMRAAAPGRAVRGEALARPADRIGSYWGNPQNADFRRASDRLLGRIASSGWCSSGCCGSTSSDRPNPLADR